MKFKVKRSSVFLSDDSLVKEGIIECSGKKADMLKELAEKKPDSVEIIGDSPKAHQDSPKKEVYTKDETFDEVPKSKKKLRK